MAIEVISNDRLVAKTPRVMNRSNIVVKVEEPNERGVLPNRVVYEPPTNVDIYGDPKPIKVVDVEIKHNYNVKKVDTANLKSDTISTSVNNKVDKLRALRNGN